MEKNKVIAIIAGIVVVILAVVAVFALNGTKEFTVTFQVDGKVVNEENVKKGEVVSKPEDPKKEGYTFDAWYLGSTKYDFSSKVKEDITLNGKFKEKSASYTITLTVDGETTETLKTDSKGLLTEPNSPVKTGYTFLGWYLDGKRVDFSVPFTKDCTLIAKFESNKKAISQAEETTTNSVNVVAVSGKTTRETNQNAAATSEVSKLIKDALGGTEVSGLSNELVSAIKEAIASGKSISVEVVQNKVDATTIKEDAAKVETFVNGATIAEYYDIDIIVKADNKEIGTVTKLDSGIIVTIDIPTSVPTKLNGVERTYAVVRVHDGVAEFLKTTENDNGTISFVTDSFSTYALTYKDEVMNVTNESEFALALNTASIETINIMNDIILTKPVSVTRAVKINGNSHMLQYEQLVSSSSSELLNSSIEDKEENMTFDGCGLIIQNANVTIQNLKIKNTLYAMYVNSSNVTFDGIVDVSNNMMAIVVNDTTKASQINAEKATIVNETEMLIPTIMIATKEYPAEVTLGSGYSHVVEDEGVKQYFVKEINLQETTSNDIVNGIETVQDSKVESYTHVSYVSVRSFSNFENVKFKITNVAQPDNANMRVCIKDGFRFVDFDEECNSFELAKDEFAEMFFGNQSTIITIDEEKGRYYEMSTAYITVDKEGKYSIEIEIYEVDTKKVIDTLKIDFEAGIADTTELAKTFSMLNIPEDLEDSAYEYIYSTYEEKDANIIYSAYSLLHDFVAKTYQAGVDTTVSELKEILARGPKKLELIDKSELETLVNSLNLPIDLEESEMEEYILSTYEEADSYIILNAYTILNKDMTTYYQTEYDNTVKELTDLIKVGPQMRGLADYSKLNPLLETVSQIKAKESEYDSALYAKFSKAITILEQVTIATNLTDYYQDMIDYYVEEYELALAILDTEVSHTKLSLDVYHVNASDEITEPTVEDFSDDINAYAEIISTDEFEKAKLRLENVGRIGVANDNATVKVYATDGEKVYDLTSEDGMDLEVKIPDEDYKADIQEDLVVEATEVGEYQADAVLYEVKDDETLKELDRKSITFEVTEVEETKINTENENLSNEE